jgi:hypothetical protein
MSIMVMWRQDTTLFLPGLGLRVFAKAGMKASKTVCWAAVSFYVTSFHSLLSLTGPVPSQGWQFLPLHSAHVHWFPKIRISPEPFLSDFPKTLLPPLGGLW